MYVCMYVGVTNTVKPLYQYLQTTTILAQHDNSIKMFYLVVIKVIKVVGLGKGAHSSEQNHQS